MKTKTKIVLATVSGVFYFLGFVGFDQWYLAWLAFVPLLIALHRTQAAKNAFFLSWWMGTVSFLGGYYWIVHLLQTFAYLSLPLATLGYLLLCIGQGLVFALFGVLAWTLCKRRGMSWSWSAPLALVVAEFIFPMLFPSYTANSQAWIPYLTQVVDIGGVLFLSGIIALINGVIAELILAKMENRAIPWKHGAVALASLVLTISYSTIRMHYLALWEASSPHLKVAIIQANVGAGDKHLRVEEGIDRYREMSDQAMNIPGVGLLVWPESGFNRVVTSSSNLTGAVATEPKVPMVIGALRGEHDGRRRKIWNSVLVVNPDGAIGGAYDKVKLLIFGEYLPGQEHFPEVFDWLVKVGLLPYLSVFERGQSLAPIAVGNYQFSANVCYEDILPRHIRELMAIRDSRGLVPQAMVNVTNDSWYGPVEPKIHLALATFRAIEHRRWLIRSTATGISAFVDSAGRVVRKSAFEKAEILVQEVPMLSGGATVYGIIGDLVGWLALGFCVLRLVMHRSGIHK